MLKWLNKPYPFFFNVYRNLIIAVSVGAFVGLFLYVFRPFSMGSMYCTLDLPLECFIYGLIASLCVLINIVFLPVIFKKQYSEDKWTIKKEILMMLSLLTMISLGNLFFARAVHPTLTEEPFIDAILRSFWHTVTIGIIPTGIFILLNYNYQLQQNLKRARRYGESYAKEPLAPAGTENVVRIESDIVKESLEFHPNDVLFISASGNYSEFHLDNGSGYRKEILRHPLQKVEDTLSDFPFIFRTHRAYLVNLLAIKSYQGSAQGIQLFFDEIQESIPVSRRRLSDFDKVMNGHKNGVHLSDPNHGHNLV